jgi:hypothetical protein
MFKIAVIDGQGAASKPDRKETEGRIQGQVEIIAWNECCRNLGNDEIKGKQGRDR